MIKKINVNELLFSDLLVKKPVEEVNEDLSSEVRGKIILTGSRGCGKSVVLGSREIESVKTEHPAILTRFDGAGMFGTKDNKYFNRSFIEHYYEVIMCKKFLNYVKEYYPELFSSKFDKLDAVTTSRLMEVDNYINNAIYKDCGLRQKLFTGEALSEMLSIFRGGTGCKSLTLMVDRFDWTHNSDPRMQDILKNYFSMFEKVIVTSDDSTIISDKRKKDLADKGFQIYGMDYSRQLDPVREIVEKRFELDGESKFPIDRVFNEDYLIMIEKSGGNLDTVLDSFLYAETLHNWDTSKDIHTILSQSCDEKVKALKQYRKMIKGPKLHL